MLFIMGDVLRKIEEMEAEIAKKQKNKAPSFQQELLKAKLAKLRRGLNLPKSKYQGSLAKEEGFEVVKTEDRRRKT